MTMPRILKTVFLLICMCIPLKLVAHTHSKHLWVQWANFAPLSQKKVDHHLFQDFLNKYRKEQSSGLVLIDYQHISDADKAKLKTYIKQLSQTTVASLNRSEQLAFWLNLYNALTINVIVDNYPAKTIHDLNISPSLFTMGPWDTNIITLVNHPMSLDDIRNRIIRPIWNDPRVLYGLYDGSIGGPSILSHPFDGDKIDMQLNQASFDYVNSPRAVQVADGKLIVSKLYDWYEEDFGGTKQTVIEHIKQFSKPSLHLQLDKTHTISSYVYNWHINTMIL